MPGGTKEYILKRILIGLFMVPAVIIFTFLLLKLAPGDPAVLMAGETATKEYIEMIREIYGLNKPLHEQLIIYLGKLFTGDFGYSFTFKRPVLDVILERVPTTLLLAGTGALIAIFFGIVLGVVAALRKDTIADNIISSLTLIFYSIPIFALAQFLILFLVINYRLFPLSGYVTIGVSPSDPIKYAMDVLWHLVLPSISLALIQMATYVKLTRTSMIESLYSNYIIAAKARGLKWRRILFKHALKNALLPIITVAGIQLGLIIGGVVITETIFSWPGVGRLTIEAIEARDFPLLNGIFVLTSVSVIIANIVTDIVYTYVDPRVKLR
jgi:peptide/nickel transport system permease protein